MVSLIPRDDYSGCTRRWFQLAPVEGNETVRFCTMCCQTVCQPDDPFSRLTLGQRALCPARPGPPRPWIVRVQFLVSWDAAQRREQLSYLVETLGSDPELRAGFSEVRSGVRYDFTLRSLVPYAGLSACTTSLRERGIAVRFNPPPEPDEPG